MPYILQQPSPQQASWHRAAAAGSKQLLDRLAMVWDNVLPAAGPQALAYVLWACGKLRYANPQLWRSTLEAFVKQLQHGEQEHDVSCHNIAIVLHGLASAALANTGNVPGISRADVQNAVRQLAESVRVLVMHLLLEGVDPQNISNTLWACAKLRINPGNAALDSMLQAMARPAMLEAAASQGLYSTLWAAVELQQRCSWQSQVPQRAWQRLLGEQQLARVADQGNPQHSGIILVALVWLSSPAAAAGATPAIGQEFAQQCAMQLLQGKVAQQLNKWDPQSIANSLWACSQLGVLDTAFFKRAAAAAPYWLPRANRAVIIQVATACRVLQYKQEQLMSGVTQRSKQQQQQQGGRQHSRPAGDVGVTAVAGYAVAMLDMQQLAGDVRDLVASSGVLHMSKANSADMSLLWEVHSWLVQHQLLDGKGLAGLLSEQQLAQGKAASEAYHAAQQQQQ